MLWLYKMENIFILITIIMKNEKEEKEEKENI